MTHPLIDTARHLLHVADGPLTRELLRVPGRFGLGQLPALTAPDATTRMVCGFCSTGCSLDVHLKQGEAVSLSPSTDYPVNLGMACPKGWEALTVLQSDDRAREPMVRSSTGRFQPVSWDTALSTFCDRFKAIQAKHGPESIAFISTGQIATEEMALLGALAKFGMGIRHGDGNTRQCMATSVVAYKQAFGFDAPPYTYQDLEESDVLIFVGANPCIAHPILWERVTRNPHDPEIVVIDPRATETAMQATRHLPLAPKSDLTLLYTLAHILIDNDWIDREFIDAHTTGFDAFATFVRDYPLERATRETGLPADLILRTAAIIHAGERVSFWWTMGVNQSHQGVRTAQAIINLALMTGNIGRPGTGANSITGQCNAMGSRLFSNTTNLLGGHDFTNPDHRLKVADVLGIEVGRIPTMNSWAYHEILEGVERGDIKGLWVIATNPAHSWIDQNQFHEIRKQLDFLVVQDMYSTTETALVADLVFPAAAWGEKEGTFINSERRIGVIKKVAKAPGQALADFAIFRLIAEYWGCGDMFTGWTSPEAVFTILKRLSRGQPCDINAAGDYGDIDAVGGVQWPCRTPAERLDRERRLFEDGQFFTPDGRAQFVFEEPRSLPEPTDQEYPFLLLTGRGTASQWHTQTRTAKSAVLRKLYPASLYVEINPHDAEALGVGPEDWVTLTSRRGEVRARALLTPTVRRGQVFLPMHDADTNRLTDAVFDPYSKQPAYKACAVHINKDHV